MNKLELRELIRRSIQGRTAFAMIRRDHDSALRDWVKTNEKRQTVVNDTIAETWMRAEREWERFGATGKELNVWLLEIAEQMLVIQRAKFAARRYDDLRCEIFGRIVRLHGGKADPGLYKDVLSEFADRLRKMDQEMNQAFSALHAKYWKAVVGYINGHPNMVRDPEDVAEDAWVKMQTRIHRYSADKGAFYTWLKSIADNLIRNLDDKTMTFQDANPDDELGGRDWPGTTPTFDQNADHHMCYLVFLKTLFAGREDPGRQIAFGFRKLLEYTPEEIVDELSDESVVELAKRLEKEYYEKGRFLIGQDSQAKHEIVECFSPLHRRVQHNTKLLKQYYYRRDPRDYIDESVYRVTKRVRPKLIKHGCSPDLLL